MFQLQTAMDRLKTMWIPENTKIKTNVLEWSDDTEEYSVVTSTEEKCTIGGLGKGLSITI